MQLTADLLASNLVLNMTVEPYGWPALENEFIAFVRYSLDMPSYIGAFERETGHSLQALLQQKEQEGADQAKVIWVAWLDWVAINVFGTKERSSGTA